MKDSYLLFLFQVLAHLSIIPMVLYADWYHWLLSFLVYFITGCFGMTITFHRLLSHRSWISPRWFEYLGTLAGTYGLVGSSIAWVAIHREHHQKTDTKSDPHSPQHRKFYVVQWLSMFDKPKPKYAANLLKSKFHLFLHKNYFYIHALIGISWLLIDPMLFLSLYAVPAAILWNIGSFVNSLNHRYGYKNFETKDSSRNIKILGYLMFGEGWHNNHHHNPRKSNFKNQWWEFDLGGFFIKLIEKPRQESAA